PVACTYANLEAIEKYRKAFQQLPRPLQEQVVAAVAAFHVFLPEEIQNEEKRIGAILLGHPLGEHEKLMQRFLKSFFENPENEAYLAWFLRVASRQHVDVWRQSEVLTAIWVKAHEKELRSRRKLEIPEGIELSKASWVLVGDKEPRKYALEQLGQALVIRSEKDSEGQVGSPIASLESTSGFVQVEIASGEAEKENYGFDCGDGAERIALPESGRVTVRSEHDEIILESLVKPDGAEAIGRDGNGFFVTIPASPERIYLDWAEDFGTDQYGLYTVFRYKGVAQTMRWIPAGKFRMGSPKKEPERLDNEIPHEVVLTHGFWLADTACTQDMWEAVMGGNPSHFKGGNRPVERMSWHDVQGFIEKINSEFPGLSLRLPSEAEWEFACRAGVTTAYSFGDDISKKQVNFDGDETVAVKSLPCNDWGLHQMHGNVWEWCQDWYGEYPAEAVVDPTGPERGEARVLRGGSWIDYARHTRSAYRYWSDPGYRGNNSGFRLARGQSAGSPGGAEKQQRSSPGQSERSGDGQGLLGKLRKFFNR
ncbi:MAG: formylglycine-generating enzyme family protein, partial [Gammaproteobacteria bacterium]